MSPLPPNPLPHQPPKPLYRLEITNLTHPGATAFLSNIDVANVLSDAVTNVIAKLYPTASPIPPVRSITLILRPEGGVANTQGLDYDDEHKRITFSTEYIRHVGSSRVKAEIVGVITHEMVHCWQWAAQGTAPGGLIEGIADWVRLRCHLAPPHWKQSADGDWDAGYQHTAYFLDHLEHRFGAGTVPRINAALRDKKYHEKAFWKDLFGKEVSVLWEEYRDHLRREREAEKESEEEPVMVRVEDANETQVAAATSAPQT
ncbi:MAG: hypothetical protein M1821_008264 [Bathelium mastoideum]|nr:MAG: hypothetical protein M1821_008264 [Bathelium mastoideum]